MTPFALRSDSARASGAVPLCAIGTTRDSSSQGPAYDLPIAVALLALAEQIPADLDGCLFLGELSLDGTLRHVNGVLPMAHLARELGYNALFVPQPDAPEAALVQGIDVYPVDTLARLAAHFRNYHPIEPYRNSLDFESQSAPYACDFQEIKGQKHDKSLELRGG